MKLPKKVFGIPLIFALIGIGVLVYVLFVRKKKTATVLAGADTIKVKIPKPGPLTTSLQTIKKTLPVITAT